MITAGVDMGIENIKIVILKDGKIVGKGSGLAGGFGRGEAALKTWNQTLEAAGITAESVEYVVATGQGKQDVSFADKTVTDAVAAARAARFFEGTAETVMDVGADQTRVVTLGDGTEIKTVVLNQKCMAGLGLLLEVAANRLGMPLDEFASVCPAVGETVLVNDGCPVFAEQGALELLNDGVAKEAIADAVVQAVAVRLNSILHDKVCPAKNTTVWIGGLTKNKALVEALKFRSGVDFVIPEDSEYGCALGAAVLATDQGA